MKNLNKQISGLERAMIYAKKDGLNSDEKKDITDKIQMSKTVLSMSVKVFKHVIAGK